jgi:hypothetical protein
MESMLVLLGTGCGKCQKKKLSRSIEGFTTESPVARLVINLMRMALPNILKPYHFIEVPQCRARQDLHYVFCSQ